MKRNQINRSLLVAAVLGIAGLTMPVAAQEENVSLGDAVTKGKISLNLNYRYEDVDVDNEDDRGRASTIRTALGYRTLWWNNLSAFVQFEDVRNIGLSNEHNNAGFGSLWNGVTDRPVIADPPITEINQAYVEWKPSSNLPIRAGRQEIIVDNARFVGNVGWRQNHQSYDAGMIHYNGFKNISLGYTFIGNQRTVTGASNAMSTSHLDGSIKLGKTGTLRAWLLSIDYDGESLWGKSTSTVGASFKGAAPVSDSLSLSYRIELATQSETADNPQSVDANYVWADLGLKVGKVTFGAGYELLGGDGTTSFNTPLATLHKFNGWADRFLATPADGLQDVFLSIKAKLGSFSLQGVYHDFSADTGGSSYGTEFDASVVYTSTWKQQFGLKFAAYDADEWTADTQKIWLFTRWGF